MSLDSFFQTHLNQLHLTRTILERFPSLSTSMLRAAGRFEVLGMVMTSPVRANDEASINLVPIHEW